MAKGKAKVKDNYKAEVKMLNNAIRQTMYGRFVFDLIETPAEEEHIEILKEYLSFVISYGETMQSSLSAIDEVFILSQLINMLNDIIDLLYLASKGDKSSLETLMQDKNIGAIINKRQKYYEENGVNTAALINISHYIDTLIYSFFKLPEFIATIEKDKQEHYLEVYSNCLKNIYQLVIQYNNIFFFKNITIENKVIDRIDISNGQWEIKYGNKPIFLKEDMEASKNIFFFINRLLKKKGIENYMSELAILPNQIFAALVRDEYNSRVPEEYKIAKNPTKPHISIKEDKFELPFINMQSSENKHSIVDTFLDNKKLLEIKNGRKYCIPKDGAVIEFLNKNKIVDKVSIIEAEEMICMKIYYLLDDLQAINRGAGEQGFLYVWDKKVLDGYFNSVEDEKLQKQYSTFSDGVVQLPWFGCDMHFKIKNPEMEGVIESSIKVFLLTCLYILYVDMNMAGVRILSQTINKDTGRAYIDREISYRTAHIRKLPTGYNPSEEAKTEAKKMGIMLPKGYTYVREFIASGEKARRVVKVRAV